MKTHPKTLLPYDERYALIDKRMLLTNAACLNAMCDFISRFTDKNSDEVAHLFGVAGSNHLDGLTDQQISDHVNSLIAKSWQMGEKLAIKIDIQND
ncbi:MULTISPECIES: hypothetical protein [unclassified Nodularia (in: cyanobacteria)]|uniref:hypothetical protein n=1 Tax=unclassified Nodularia (in: cyanobacteria) TaxID=2656917 RepID=UPI0018805C9B|nr:MULTISPECIES: hypothetical protein [unclassified Nodularia (in: cyanobacteria)]MBE9201507.1 hypothetical protein [Nodularia sp. LEGE 06071]MCC2695796.1 hypothetical protein [Nodularia sp. LEGE 04288]